MSYKSGFVGLIGHPNSGKSTLTNLLVGEKVSIVSSKPQTTRKKAIGILSDDDAQIILVDPPGVINSKGGLNHFLKAEYEKVMDESDVLVAVLNLDEPSFESLSEIIDLVHKTGKPWFAVITKKDVNKPQREKIIIQYVNQLGADFLVVSAQDNPKVCKSEIIEMAKKSLPESKAPLYDTELYTTQNVKELTKETIREKCFQTLYHEIPYGLDVRITNFDESRDGLVKIYADIIVSKDRHQPMVIGVKGANIKTIGVESRKDLETLLGSKVFLDLHVAVRKNWVKNKEILKELGYVNI